MKITDNRNQNSLYFKDIAIGEVFICRECIYIKLNDMVLDDTCIVNGIELTDGSIAYFSEMDSVTYVNAELIIRGA